MDPKKHLEMLKKKREELVAKNSANMREQINAILHPKPLAPDPVAKPASAAPRDAKFKESADLPLYSLRKEGQKVTLEVGVQINNDDAKPRIEEGKENISESSDDEDKKAGSSKLDVAEIREQGTAKPAKQVEDVPDFKLLNNDEVENLMGNNPKLKSSLADFERLLNRELEGPKNKMDLIEDYINIQNRDVQEQKGGYTVKKYDDVEMESKYQAFDVLFMKDSVTESENIAVVFCKAQLLKEQTDYCIGIYNQEKRFAMKNSRSEIKKITGDAESEKMIYGGLDNGKIAIWDLRSERLLPDSLTKVGEKCNYLPISDLVKMGNFAFSLGQEGRLCKWDLRKLDEPLLFHDIYCENENIAKLESMTLGLLVDPIEADTIYVNTAEGSVYEFLLTPSSIQQRNLFANLHEAPIIKIQSLDIKNYFKEASLNKKYSEFVTPQTKFINYWASASFDWSIKIYKGTFATEEGVIKYHNEFVTGLESNKLNPFLMASADAEGKLAVWKLDRPNWDSPLFEWNNSCAIHRISWNSSGTKLAVVDTKGGLNVIGFPKGKLVLNEKAMAYYLKNGVKLNFRN